MTIELKMPALSPTMEKGTLAKWLVAVGDIVKPGDLLAEIETDKATMEFEAVDEGQIASIVIPDGTEDVAVGTVLAFLSEESRTINAPELGTASDAAAISKVEAEPAPVAAPTQSLIKPVLPPKVDVTTPSAAAKSVMADDTSINATPLARRIAKMRGLSLLGVTGSGASGRIVRADLGFASRIGARPAAPTVVASASAPVAVFAAPEGVPHTPLKLSSMRKTIARRLTESKQTVPHFYLSTHCNLDALLKLRGELNSSLAGRGVKLSVNDLLIKAMALAMQREPDTNVQFAGDEMYRFDRIDIAIAVAIEGGLITPVIRDVGSLSLSAIAEHSKRLAGKARDGKLLPEDYQSGTASISNLGMFGIDQIFPVINPPQALILGIGSGIEKPWKVDGAIALATILSATASFDHRAIDGAAGARFMAAFRDLVENPLQIIC